MSTSPTEIELLNALVATPSVSGSEEACGRLVESTVREWGLDVVRDEAGVRVELRSEKPGPTMALVSHLDVVPPGEGWTRDPFVPVIEKGRLYGRGSGDAKASVSAMLTAALDVARGGGPKQGRLLVVLGYGEETRNTTMPDAIHRSGPIDAAVVGEPTNLEFAIAQRGLMMIDLVARGTQRHAAYATEEDFTNSLEVLSRDISRLSTLCQDRPHKVLGHPTITPTMVSAGVSRNVTPPVARAVLDVRSTPRWAHDELAVAIRRSVTSEVVVTSDRLVPCETPPGSRLLKAARTVNSKAQLYGSPTCSDWVFLRHVDAFKCGPGTSKVSHTPDEWVDLAEVSTARTFYARLVETYLGELDHG
jgi:acetylornithine deacetylase